jgi:hypothetical protein
MRPTRRTWGILAEFERPDEVVRAAELARSHGYRVLEAYSPFPVEGLAAALGFRHSRLPLLVLVGGILGGAGGFFLQYWVSVIEYPQIVGGKPDNSWPAFIPITFEMTVLVAALTAVLGMLGMNGLPRPHHPLFAVPEFERASRDRFFLALAATDPLYDPVTSRAFFEELHPISLREVSE